MKRKVLSIVSVLIIASVAIALVACGAAGKSSKATDRLEIFSWWTAGGEAEGLNAMYDQYKKAYPKVEIVNATVSGGAGTNAMAVLSTRLTGGDPPDAFHSMPDWKWRNTIPRNTYSPSTPSIRPKAWTRSSPRILSPPPVQGPLLGRSREHPPGQRNVVQQETFRRQQVEAPYNLGRVLQGRESLQGQGNHSPRHRHQRGMGSGSYLRDHPDLDSRRRGLQGPLERGYAMDGRQGDQGAGDLQEAGPVHEHRLLRPHMGSGSPVSRG